MDSFDEMMDMPSRDEIIYQTQRLGEISFPFSYEIYPGTGSTDHKQWRVVAWIATSEDPDNPQSGEWYGTTVYDLAECGAFNGDYCEITPNVDLLIDTQLP